MAKWANALVLDGGPDLLRTRSGTADRIKLHLLNTYADDDSFATAVAASLGSIGLASPDFTTAGAAARITTVAAKQLNITANAVAPDLHIALIDHVANVVLLVTDETTNALVTIGNVFNVPPWTFTINQPT